MIQEPVIHDIDISNNLHMIRELLPVMEKINEEKMIELESVAKNKGIWCQNR